MSSVARCSLTASFSRRLTDACHALSVAVRASASHRATETAQVQLLPPRAAAARLVAERFHLRQEGQGLSAAVGSALGVPPVQPSAPRPALTSRGRRGGAAEVVDVVPHASSPNAPSPLPLMACGLAGAGIAVAGDGTSLLYSALAAVDLPWRVGRCRRTPPTVLLLLCAIDALGDEE